MKNLIKKLLIKTQKLTETDNVYIAKHGFHLAVGNIVSMIAAFLLSIVFAQLLPKETYGNYRYILSIMSILAIASLEGINKSVIQGVANGFDGVLKQGFKTRLVWSLFGSIASVGVAIYFWINGNIEFTASFLIIAVFMPLFKSGEIYQSYLDGKKLFGKRVAYTTLIQVLATASIIVTLFLTKSLVILILVYFLSYSLLRMFFLFWTIKKIGSNNVESEKTISYGKHLSLMQILATASQQIDNILLFFFLGPIKLAIYSFATLTVDYIRTPLQIIQELALPKLTIKPIDDIKKTLPKKLLWTSLLIVLAIILYIIFAPFLYKILYPQYLDSIPYSRLFSLTLLVFPISMLALALQAKMKTKMLYKVSLIQAITQLIFLAILTPIYGITGAIIARLISYIFYFFYSWFSFKNC